MPTQTVPVPSASTPYTERPRGHGLEGRILRASLQLVRDHGEAGLTMRAIARRTRMPPMGILRHFASREAMVESIRRHGIDELRRWLCNAECSGDRCTRLEGLCQAYLAFALDRPWLYRFLFRAPRIERPDAAIEAFTRAAVALLPATPEARERAQILWVAMHGLASASCGVDVGTLERARASEPAIADAYIRSLLRGL